MSKPVARFLSVVLLHFSVLSSSTLFPQQPSTIRSWSDLKFSMFIHFGMYSQLGGVWDGKPISRGLSEQIQAHAGIYSDTYARVAKEFNPVNWNADSIALLAKSAGMGSIVITSKHHDGFAMFDSKFSEFDIVDASPYGKDVIKELSDACKRHGLKMGLYFSLIDWHFPQASPISSHNSDYITPEHHQFNLNQVTELLSRYGTISELWFDMGSMSLAQSREMRELVHRLQPECLIGSRIGNDMGDFTVMGDNQEPDYIIGVPWQSPASFFDETWGYRSWQKRTDINEKYREKLTSLIRVTSRGGNYLLNIGPRGDGTVVEYERDVLLRIGKWLERNGEAIYKTEPDPFHIRFDWGAVTRSGNRLYLHLLDKPASNEILLPGLKGRVSRAYILDDNTSCRTNSSDRGLMVSIPSNLDAKSDIRVIAIEFESTFTLPPANPIHVDGQRLVLDHQNSFPYYSNSGIDYNTRFTSTIREEWNLSSPRNGTVHPTLIYSEQEKGKKIRLQLVKDETTLLLDGDRSQTLNTDAASVEFGPVYLLGPIFSGIDGVHGDIQQIDPQKPWPAKNGQAWKRPDDWRNDRVYRLPADMMTAYYWLQDIETKKEQAILIRVSFGDGVNVFLNGERRSIQLNADKDSLQEQIVLLPLRKGKNQLLIKSFNNFQKNLTIGVARSIPQLIYAKRLEPVSLKKGSFFPVAWELAEPLTPHQHMNMPNLQLQLLGVK